MKQQLRSALVAALTFPFTVLAAVHGLSGLFSGGIRGRAFTLPPSSPPPPSPFLISILASVDVKQYGQGQVRVLISVCRRGQLGLRLRSSRLPRSIRRRLPPQELAQQQDQLSRHRVFIDYPRRTCRQHLGCICVTGQSGSRRYTRVSSRAVG